MVRPEFLPSVRELSGRTVQYAYDNLYRLTSETIAGAASQNGTIAYQYDAVGNRKQLNSTVPAIPPTGLLSYDANDRTTTSPYDANSNLLLGAAGGNVYDFENRVVQAGNVKIVYDGDGNRVLETVAGTTTTYTVAEVNPTGYAQVIEERKRVGLDPFSGTNDYIYGLELPRAKTLANNTFNTIFYGMDGHGSVRFLTNNTGRIKDVYDKRCGSAPTEPRNAGFLQ